MVVVPSVAIKEGVNKTLQITREHFEFVPRCKGLRGFFQYDSDRLGEVRNFATSPNIQIMVITIQAMVKFGDENAAAAEEANEAIRREKSKNKMYRTSEKTGGERPIDLIRNTRPILIVDEPQSVDGGNDGKGQSLGPDEPVVLFALFRHAHGQAQHGLPAGCCGRLRAEVGKADRGCGGYRARRQQQSLT